MRTIGLCLLLGIVGCGKGSDTSDTIDTNTGGDDTDADTDTDTGPACTALKTGTWDADGSALGMSMSVKLTMDATACTFTLTNWSMNMGDLPDSGSVSGSDVTMGSSSYWSKCTATADSETSFTGTCDDGAAFEFTAR